MLVKGIFYAIYDTAFSCLHPWLCGNVAISSLGIYTRDSYISGWICAARD